jgi:signal transduction histidine kinase
MAEHEAQLRGQDLAEQAAATLATAWNLAPPTNSGTILVSFNGELVSPRPVMGGAPDEGLLTADQSNLFHRARSAEFIAGDTANAMELFQRFLATKPPSQFAQQARYALGLLFVASRDVTNAIRTFRAMVAEDAATSEGGADLHTLALMRLAQLDGSGFDSAGSNAVSHPTLLTGEILRFLFDEAPAAERGKISTWWEVWQEQERLRKVYAELSASFRTNILGGATNLWGKATTQRVQPPDWRWIELRDAGVLHSTLIQGERGRRGLFVPDRPSSTYLIERRTDSTNHVLAVWTATALSRWASERIESLRPPQYFGVSVSIGDRDVIKPVDLPEIVASGGAKGSGRIWAKSNRTNAPPALATATRPSPNKSLMVARVHLIGPNLLYEQQNARRLWFMMVVSAAVIVSLIGFASAYRAFRKQMLLAEMKSNFVSSVSHELRAPIASVRLMAEGLERGRISDPAKQRDYFRFISQECRRLSSMIENVLGFARIEQGREHYEFEPTNLRALVQQTVNLMEPYAAERGVNLIVKLECRDPDAADPGSEERCVATVDGQSIQQALVNLLDNAIKHSPGGSEVAVALSLHAQLSTINLSVQDHGPGIPLGEHQRIFDRFYRLGSELRRETPGVGIGLSIVKHIVEAHGGTIRVESEVGKGSCFTMVIPVSPGPGKEMAS